MLDPGHERCALVKVYEPIKGRAPMKVAGKWLQRKEYLWVKYGLQDRVTATGSRHAGWKSSKLDDEERKCFHVRWFPECRGREFYDLWKLYLTEQRVAPPEGDKHPYAFTNQLGLPATIKKFEEAHQRAVEKIGLVAGKKNGLSAHGHRHAFGKRMSGKLEPLYIQLGLHHRSLDSQTVYTQPSSEEINREFSNASRKLNESSPDKNMGPLIFGVDD